MAVRSRVILSKEAEALQCSGFEQPSNVLPGFKVKSTKNLPAYNTQPPPNILSSGQSSFDCSSKLTFTSVDSQSAYSAFEGGNRRSNNNLTCNRHFKSWVEPCMANNSPHTETSTDIEGEGKLEAGCLHESTGVSTNSEHETTKTSDSKTLRRLAQNREAARKSRLRKKAYVQQLESSRSKLNQLEQELHRARQQGFFLGAYNDQLAHTGGVTNVNSALNPSMCARFFNIEVWARAC